MTLAAWGNLPAPPAADERCWGERNAPLPPVEGSLLPYGNGRSYGDVCLNSGATLLYTRGLDHLAFGSVLGTDKKPLKTRSGELFTLKALLDEAIQRGTDQVKLRATQTDSPTQGTTDHEIAAIGRAVGIAAVKYADLSGDPIKDYVFDLDRMIAFEGDTGPYIQYAHARIASLISKSDAADSAISNSAWKFDHPAERALVLAILSFPATIKAAADLGSPQRVCAALHELAN